jgi:DNA-binding transcriptional ArsR family regulator
MVNHNDDQLLDDQLLDALFTALGDGTRRGIVAVLSDGRDHAVGDLAAPFRMTLPAVTKHLRVLEDAAVVTSEKRGRVRYCRLQPRILRPVMDWLEHHRRFWEQRFDELETYLEETDPDRDAAADLPPAVPPTPPPSTLGYDPFPDFFPGKPAKAGLPEPGAAKSPRKNTAKTSAKAPKKSRSN